MKGRETGLFLVRSSPGVRKSDGRSCPRDFYPGGWERRGLAEKKEKKEETWRG